jgi:hypothetical protein
MTTRLYAHASTAAAVLLTAAACYAHTLNAGWPALSGLLPAAVFAWNARRCYDQARHEQAVLQRLERLRNERTPPVPPLPCCSFWLHSDGEVHAPDCTRPAAARTTLTPLEEREFTRIVAGLQALAEMDESEPVPPAVVHPDASQQVSASPGVDDSGRPLPTEPFRDLDTPKKGT